MYWGVGGWLLAEPHPVDRWFRDARGHREQFSAPAVANAGADRSAGSGHIVVVLERLVHTNRFVADEAGVMHTHPGDRVSAPPGM